MGDLPPSSPSSRPASSSSSAGRRPTSSPSSGSGPRAVPAFRSSGSGTRSGSRSTRRCGGSMRSSTGRPRRDPRDVGRATGWSDSSQPRPGGVVRARVLGRAVRRRPHVRRVGAVDRCGSRCREEHRPARPRPRGERQARRTGPGARCPGPIPPRPLPPQRHRPPRHRPPRHRPPRHRAHTDTAPPTSPNGTTRRSPPALAVRPELTMRTHARATRRTDHHVRQVPAGGGGLPCCG